MVINFFSKTNTNKINGNKHFLVIELACGEHGTDKIDRMVKGTENGKTLQWMKHHASLPSARTLRGKISTKKKHNPI